MAAERGTNGRFRRAGAEASETLVPRETDRFTEPVDEPTPIGILPLQLVVDDVTPGIERTGTPPPPAVLPPEAEAGPDVDDEPLYLSATRGLDWGIGAALGEHYRATPEHIETVAEAAAPVARRLADLVGAAEAVDATVPPWIRELVVLAAAVYVAWGDALEVVARDAIDRIRHRGDEDDAGAQDRPPRGADERTRGRDRSARRDGASAGGVAGPHEAPETGGLRPPGPSEGRSAELAAGFASGRALGSNAS